MKSSRYFISVYYRRLNRKRECKFASVEWIFLNGSLILRIAAVIGTAFPTRWNHVFIIELSLNKNNIWNIFFFGKEEKKKTLKTWNLQGFEKAKYKATGTCTFYLKRIHQVTSRHQKIRVDENRVGGTYFVYLYSFPRYKTRERIENIV